MHPEHFDELLAWYVNGTLTAKEHHDIEQHLETCVRCQKEIALLQKIRTQIKADKPDAPGDFGLHRLMRDIQRKQTTPAHKRGGWQPSLAAAAIIIVIQGIVLMNLFYQPAPIAPRGGPSTQAVVLQVKFSSNATEQQIRDLLQKIHGTLVGGPGALGIYRVQLAGGAHVRDETIQKTIADMRAHTDTVTYVAPE